MKIRGIKSIGEPSKNPNQYILELLLEGGKSYSEIRIYLKNKGINKSPKGLSLILDRLRADGFIGRRPLKQGHYSYFLSKKGKMDIELQAKVFSYSLQGLLRAHLPPFDNDEQFTEDYFLNLLIKRIGIFVMFSFFQSLRLASQKPASRKISAMSEWQNNSFSFKPVDNYFMDKKDSFLQFKSGEEALEDYFSSQKKQDQIQRLEEIFKKKFLSEYEFCEETIRNQSYHVKSELAQVRYEKNIEQYLKHIHKKHKEHKNLIPSECPECDLEHKEKSSSANMTEIRKLIFYEDGEENNY